ncbi:hypothetical protein GGI35DRAFT_169094 [Trichoderma velutinum]
MGKLQDVTRFLLAAGGSPSADGKSTHLFHEEQNSLFMETWTGSELTDRVQVVTGVRSDTSAPLVYLHYKRIFVVDQTHVLKCFTETLRAEDEDDDDDEEEEDSLWEDEELDGLDITVHPKSQLAVSCGEFAIVVFYQNPNGTIGAIEDDGYGWKIAQLPSSEALSGTPMASFQAKDAIYFVYVAADQTFRYMEHSNNEWKDAPFSSVKADGAAAKISLAEDEKAESDPKLLVFCLANNKLSTIKLGSTEAETWGTVEDGLYKPTSDQENNGSPQGSIPFPFHPGSLFIYSSGPPPPPPPPVTSYVPVAPFACYEDFGHLTLSDPEYHQPVYRTQPPPPPPPYDNDYDRFDERYYEPHDETILRQSVQRPETRSAPQQQHYDPSWQPPYQRPFSVRDFYHRDPYHRDPYQRDPFFRDPYQRDPYYRDRYPQDYYQRDPHQQDFDQRPPQELSRQQPRPGELPRQQQPPPQELSRQQEPPLGEIPRQQQPPMQELARQRQPPEQEAPRQQERAPPQPSVESEEDEDDPSPQPQPQPQPQTQRQRAAPPNPEEAIQEQQQQRQQQQQQQQQQQRNQQQQQQHRTLSPSIKSEDDDETFQRRRPQTQGQRARQTQFEETAPRQQPLRPRTFLESELDEDEDAADFLREFRRFRQEARERARQEELPRARQEETQRAHRHPPQHRGYHYEPQNPYIYHEFDDHRPPHRTLHRTQPDPVIKFRTYHYITSMRCRQCNRRYKRMNRGLPFGRSHEWAKKCRC